MLSAVIPFCNLRRYSIMVSDGPTQMSTLCDAIELWAITSEHDISEVMVPSCWITIQREQRYVLQIG